MKESIENAIQKARFSCHGHLHRFSKRFHKIFSRYAMVWDSLCVISVYQIPYRYHHFHRSVSICLHITRTWLKGLSPKLEGMFMNTLCEI